MGTIVKLSVTCSALRPWNNCYSEARAHVGNNCYTEARAHGGNNCYTKARAHGGNNCYTEARAHVGNNCYAVSYLFNTETGAAQKACASCCSLC